MDVVEAFAVVILSIGVAFLGAMYSGAPHSIAQYAAAAAGFASALTWGLSVVGYFVLQDIAPGLTSPLWNGWLNLLAAIAAAMTAGFATI
jgi:hypothetical protein